MAIFKDLELQSLELGKRLQVGGGTEDARVLFGMHRRRHRGEREDALHPELPRRFDELAAEGVLAHGRLRFTEEDDDIVLLLGVAPGEEPAPRQAAGTDQTALDLNVVHFEELLPRAARQAGACPVSPSSSNPH